MILTELLSQLAKLNISLSLEQGSLKCKAPVGAMNNELKLALKSHKQEIIEYLSKQKSDTRINPVALNKVKASFRMLDWFNAEMQGGKNYQITPTIVHFTQEYQPELFDKALRALCQRHTILNAVFSCEQEQLHIEIDSNFSPYIRYQDMREQAYEQADVDHVISKSLNLDCITKGKPLNEIGVPPWFAQVIELKNQEFILVLVIDHMITDAVSSSILAEELPLIYSAMLQDQKADLPKLDFSVLDYCHWQSVVYPSSDVWREGQAFWTELYQQSEKARLTHQQTLTHEKATSVVSFNTYLLPKVASQRFVRQIQERKISLSHALYVLTAQCLAELTDTNNPCLGNVLAGRSMAGIERVVNNFADMYFIPVFGVKDTCFIELAEQVASSIGKVNHYQHQEHRAFIPEHYSPGVHTEIPEPSSAFAFGMEVNTFATIETLKNAQVGKLYSHYSELDIPFEWIGIRFSEKEGYLTCSININELHFSQNMAEQVFNLLTEKLNQVNHDLEKQSLCFA
ncbi:hypothetical protein HR060_09895 [Catenovulum sp. SM1970]|uniref:condensation domain-containing protein n=1 Tax=Marinifaba aquimaris TaxID=2741323 RepID=UPI001571745A|nr:condensation domain-containing protein [Marinifaba aquimaris]NTS77175.1 hypothetical protein [Marinifaba aquimaris]